MYGKPDDKPERQRANPAEPRAPKRQHAKPECLDRICVQHLLALLVLMVYMHEQLVRKTRRS